MRKTRRSICTPRLLLFPRICHQKIIILYCFHNKSTDCTLNRALEPTAHFTCSVFPAFCLRFCSSLHSNSCVYRRYTTNGLPVYYVCIGTSTHTHPQYIFGVQQYYCCVRREHYNKLVFCASNKTAWSISIAITVFDKSSLSAENAPARRRAAQNNIMYI